jgi:hypothetical protein
MSAETEDSICNGFATVRVEPKAGDKVDLLIEEELIGEFDTYTDALSFAIHLFND